MAKYTVTEFAELCGKSRGYITTYIGRGVIVKTAKKGKVIDDQVQENIDFMLKCGITPEGYVPPVEPEPKPLSPIPSENSANSGQYELNLQKADADIALKNQRLVLMQLEEAKIRGQQIPTPFVRDLIAAFSSQIINTYKEMSDQFLIEVAHSTKISGKKSAELKGKMIDMINKAHDKAIDKAIGDLESVINDQKQKNAKLR